MFFSSNLKYLRVKNKLSQSKLADKLGVNQTTIARWEEDNRVPTIDNAVDVSNVLNIPLERLLGVDLTKEENTSQINDDIIILYNKTKHILNDTERDLIIGVMKNALNKKEGKK